jgi:L-rhamnose isomerase/sugar isomerase
MLDQSHNVTDPMESLISSTVELQRACAQAWLIDRGALDDLQERNDALMASQLLKQAYTTDVGPILARARQGRGGAIDPLAALRASGYRRACAESRPAVRAAGGSIV